MGGAAEKWEMGNALGTRNTLAPPKATSTD